MRVHSSLINSYNNRSNKPIMLHNTPSPSLTTLNIPYSIHTKRPKLPKNIQIKIPFCPANKNPQKSPNPHIKYLN